MSKLHELQQKVHVAKDKRNDFGKYNYRTAEGILAAAKAQLPDGAYIVLTDDIEERAGYFFVRATAKAVFSKDDIVEASAYAGHPLDKKGMDFSQITGAASSYARKYALQGLLALDDGSVDPDATNRGQGDTTELYTKTLSNVPHIKNREEGLGLMHTCKGKLSDDQYKRLGLEIKKHLEKLEAAQQTFDEMPI